MSLKSSVKLRANVVKAYTGRMRGIETEARRRLALPVSRKKNPAIASGAL